MKIRWLESGNWEVVTGVDGTTGEPTIGRILVKAGDEVEVQIVQNNHDFNTSTIVYEDGTVLYGVPQHTFQVI